jgi:hypothetical protein
MMMKSSLFRVFAAIAVLLLAVAGAYTAYWFLTANRLQAGLDKWAAERRMQGYDLAWSKEAIAGFPLAFRIVLADASIARGNSYRVTVPEISGTAAPWNLSHWRIAAPRGGDGTLQGVDASIAAQSLSGDVLLGADASDLTVSILGLAGAGAAAGELTAHVTLPRITPRGHRDLGLAASVQLFHLTLPKPVTALGDTIENVAADFRIMGGLPPGDWRQALAAWRDDGGTVELTQGDLQWGPLRLEVDGTLALDGGMQPIAALHASIVDHAALLDAAVAAGMLPARNAVLVKLVLDIIASRGADGGTRLTAPVTVQDGKFAIGRAEIGKVPRIEWK